MIPAYQTFVDKDPRFISSRITDFDNVLSRLTQMEQDGYYFRGQGDASWKLFTSVQREWLLNRGGIRLKYASIHNFNQNHIDYQRTHAKSQLSEYCQQLNDITILSTLQHFGGPTPFLDFTTDKNKALYFATNYSPASTGKETTNFMSIYAWKPGNGPATGTINDLFNWERIIDQYQGVRDAFSLTTLQELSTIYIKQDTGNFLNIANPRLIKQGGLFLYSPVCLRKLWPLENIFDGKTANDVVDHCESLFIPKMVCLDIPKMLAPDIKRHVQDAGVDSQSLGLTGIDWANTVYLQLWQDSNTANAYR